MHPDNPPVAYTYCTKAYITVEDPHRGTLRALAALGLDDAPLKITARCAAYWTCKRGDICFAYEITASQVRFDRSGRAWLTCTIDGTTCKLTPCGTWTLTVER